ncbi:MAG: HNH endonuclease [Candidatus Gracilibacteria bacterium]
MDNLMQIPDGELLSLCRQYGRNALLWRKKFEGLLPEVFRRRLYEKENCLSVYEFAAKFAGFSEAQVKTALRVERKLQGKPILLDSFHSGEISAGKLDRAADIATTENEKEIDKMARVLPARTFETYVRDQKRAVAAVTAEAENLPTLFSVPTLHVQRFKLENDVIEELNRLQDMRKDVNELLREFLKQKNQETEQKEQELSECAREETHLPSRTHYKKAIRDFLHEKYGKKCAYRGCNKPAEEIHHKIRFGLQANHDPAYLVPLCSEHHKIAHAIDALVVGYWKKGGANLRQENQLCRRRSFP